jgi:hypothetical protein
MKIEEAVAALGAFGDKAVAAGVFKGMGDAMAYKEAVDVVVVSLNELVVRCNRLKVELEEFKEPKTTLCDTE